MNEKGLKLDYSLADIMEEWVEDNKNRPEAERDQIPTAADNRTVKDTIKRIEDNYFEGRHLYRRGGDKSDYLFRYEIKELLVALLKLELGDCFRDGRSKKTGVSLKSIDHIKKMHKNFYDYTMPRLRPHEKHILNLSYDFNTSIACYNGFDNLRRSLSGFLLMSAQRFNNNGSNFLNDITCQLDAWSTRTILKQYAIMSSHAYVDKESFISLADPEGFFEYSIDLKKAIAKSVDRIASIVYTFDDKGTCRRRPMEKVTEQWLNGLNGKQADTKLTKEKAELKTLYYAAVKVDRLLNNPQAEHEEEDIETFNNFLLNLVKHLYPKIKYQSKLTGDRKKDWSPSFYEYIIEYLYLYNAFMNNDPSLDQNSKLELLNRREALRTELIYDFPFGDTLIDLEMQIVELTKGKSYSNLGEFKDDEEIEETVLAHLAHFSNNIRQNGVVSDYWYEDVLSNLEQGKLGNPIISNYQLLYEQCDKLLSNVFVMIMRLENERQKIYDSTKKTIDAGIKKFIDNMELKALYGDKDDRIVEDYWSSMHEYERLVIEGIAMYNEEADRIEAYNYYDHILKCMGLKLPVDIAAKALDDYDTENEDKYKT